MRKSRRQRGRIEACLVAVAVAVAAGASALILSCASEWKILRSSPSIAVSQIVAMSQEGMAADAMIEKLRASQTVYRLSAAQLVNLHEQGVPDPVLDYMQETLVASEARHRLPRVRAADASACPRRSSDCGRCRPSESTDVRRRRRPRLQGVAHS